MQEAISIIIYLAEIFIVFILLELMKGINRK